MTRAVYLVTPGGRRGRGGIGRLVDVTLDAWGEAWDGGEAPPLRVVDSYGPDRKGLMPFYFLAACVRLTLACALGRALIVHVNMAERGSVWRKGLVVWIGRAWRVPVVIHCHGADFADYVRALTPPKRRLLLKTLNAAARIVVLGGRWRRFFTDELGLAPARIAVLANAVPDPRRDGAPVAAGARSEAKGDGPLRVLFLGRLGERKGVPELLQALASPTLRRAPWRAVLAGDGEVGRFRTEAVVLGLDHKVRLSGWVDKAGAQALLADSDVLVLPSRNEGLPVAILEAMAHGLAVVASDVGAIPDVIDDGDNGLLVAPGDVAGLTGALRRLIDEPGLGPRMGARGRARFEAAYAIECHVRGLAAIYADLLRARPGGAAAVEKLRAG